MHPAAVIQTAGAAVRSFQPDLDPIKAGKNNGNSTAESAQQAPSSWRGFRHSDFQWRTQCVA